MPPPRSARSTKLFSPPPSPLSASSLADKSTCAPSPPRTRKRRVHRQISTSACLASLVCIFLITSDLSLFQVAARLGITRWFVPHHALHCRRPMRVAKGGDKWQICTPNRWALQGGLVYSVGVGNNIAWDKQLMAQYDTEHHAWDPTPTALAFMRRAVTPDTFHFHRVGLGPRDGNLTLKLPYGNRHSYTIMAHPNDAQKGTVIEVQALTVRSMLRRMRHRHLAILKIDIEGGEFDVIAEWARTRYRVPADQVLVEFHERYFWKQPGYRNLVPNAVRKMQTLGFTLVAKSRLEYTFARIEAIADLDQLGM